MIRIFRTIPGHCARRAHSTNRLTYVLVPDPSPAGASNPNTRLPSSWYPIDCSRLNLSNQFATNTVALLSPTSLSQEVPSRGSDGPYPSGVVKITSPNIVAPPKPPGPEDCCMSGCATCVYDIYAQESEEYLESLKQRNHLNEHDQGASKAEQTDMKLTEEIDDQVVLNNSLKVFAQFEKNRHRWSSCTFFPHPQIARLTCSLTSFFCLFNHASLWFSATSFFLLPADLSTRYVNHLFCMYFCIEAPTWIFWLYLWCSNRLECLYFLEFNIGLWNS